MLLERKAIKDCFKLLTPHFIIFVLLGLVYLNLFIASPLSADTEKTYSLYINFTVLENFWFYLTKALYIDAVGIYFSIAGSALILIAAITSSQIRPVLVVCFVGFCMLLGPVLLLSNHLDKLYLYAPHFFLAFAFGALLSVNLHFSIAASICSLIIVITPISSNWAANVHNFYNVKTSNILMQYESFKLISSKIEKGSRLFISGLDRYFNPFSNGPGRAVKIMKKDQSLKLFIEKPKSELSREFCTSTTPKYFFHYEMNQLIDETSTMLENCK